MMKYISIIAAVMQADNGSFAKMGRSTRESKNEEATTCQDVATLEALPNVGHSVAAFLRQLGITQPDDLLGRDPYEMYDDLCGITGQRHDPCLLDTFIAAVRFMASEPKKLWWKYTAERKRELANRKK